MLLIFEQQTGMEIYQPGTKTLGKVAIIGAGPAGLQASVTLTNRGYDVTIYEKEAHPVAGCVTVFRNSGYRNQCWMQRSPVLKNGRDH
ncbi:NAD(P)-binding protein [Escherichia coli]